MKLEKIKYCPKDGERLWHFSYDPNLMQVARGMNAAVKDVEEGKAISAAMRAGLIIAGKMGIVYFYFCKKCHHVSR